MYLAQDLGHFNIHIDDQRNVCAVIRRILALIKPFLFSMITHT